MDNIDIFGTNFTFTVNQEKKFKTTFGGFLTIFCITICSSMSLLLGKDFYYRLNPKVLQQNIIQENHEKFVIDNNNFTIAWRIENSIGNPVEYNGILYPKINFYHYETTNVKNQSNFELKKNIRLNVTNCSSLYYNSNNNIKNIININEWNCLDFSSIYSLFGGFWNSQFLYYFSLSLETCDINPNSPNSTICSNRKKINKFLEEEKFISLMFPQAIFSYDDLINPLHIKYKNFFRGIDSTLLRYDVCDFNRAFLSDDKGWILKEYVNYTGINYINCDLTVNSRQSLDDNKNVKMILIEFYLKKSLIYSQRIFMKLQDLAAIMGGFFNIVFLFFNSANMYINDFEMLKIFVDKLFKFSIDTNEKWEKFSHFKKVNFLLHQNDNYNNCKVNDDKKKSKIINNEKENQKTRGKSVIKINLKEEEIRENRKCLYNEKKKQRINENEMNKKYNFDHDNENETQISEFNLKSYNTFLNDQLNNKNLNDSKKYKLNDKQDKMEAYQYPSLQLKLMNNGNRKIMELYQQISNTSRVQQIKDKIEKLKFKYKNNAEGVYQKNKLLNNDQQDLDNNSDKRSRNLFLEFVKNKSLFKPQENTVDKAKNSFDIELGDTIDIIELNKDFNFSMMISKSSNIYKDVFFLKNLCFKIFKIGHKNRKDYKKFLTFNNGIFILNKNLDLIRYLKNLQMIKMMGKLLFNQNQRYCLKNFYKNILDKEYEFDDKKKEKRHREKYEKLMIYFNKMSTKNYEGIGKMDKMLIENIFNS